MNFNFNMFRTLAVFLALVAVALAAPGYIAEPHVVAVSPVVVPVVKHVPVAVPVAVPVVKTYTPVVHHQAAYVPVVKSYGAVHAGHYGHIYG